MDLFPGRDVQRVIDDAAMDVHHRRDADADALHLRTDDPADLGRQIIQCLLQGGPGRKGGDRKTLHDLPCFDQAETKVCAADINAERHGVIVVLKIRLSCYYFKFL